MIKLKTNSIANILFIVGIVIMIIGFILGFVFGIQTYSVFGMEILWFVVFTYWFGGLTTGLLFIGIAEIIEILDTKLGSINEKLPDNPKLQPKNQAEKKISSHLSEIDKQTLSKAEGNFIKEHFDEKGIEVNNISKTPLDGLCVVEFSDGIEKIIDIRGFSPEEVPSEKWDYKMKAWFEEREI